MANDDPKNAWLVKLDVFCNGKNSVHKNLQTHTEGQKATKLVDDLMTLLTQ